MPSESNSYAVHLATFAECALIRVPPWTSKMHAHRVRNLGNIALPHSEHAHCDRFQNT